MKTSTIFIPKKLNIGFQDRGDTYTGRLAYVIYYDEKNKLRKEKSWNQWRDQNIPNEEYANEPTEGFVLNKNVGDYDSGWNHRRAYCRVYDPRGFEFEITIENLLYILANTSCIKGKGLEGGFVYGWDGTELLLIPTCSPDYKSMVEYANKLENDDVVKTKDLVVGGMYLSKNEETYIYMGKYPYNDTVYEFESNGEVKTVSKYSQIEYDSRNYGKKVPYKEIRKNTGVRHWFCRYSEYNGKHLFEFEAYKSIPKKLITTISKDQCEVYQEALENMQCLPTFSLPDNSKSEIIRYTEKEFMDIVKDRHFRYTRRFMYTDTLEICILTVNKDNTINMKLDLSDGNDMLRYYGVGEISKGQEAIDKFMSISSAEKIENENWLSMKEVSYEAKNVSAKEIFEKLHPSHIQTYLENGRKYEDIGKLI